MYSTILADGRLRDLVNGHNSLSAPSFPSEPVWSAGMRDLLDGSAGFDATRGFREAAASQQSTNSAAGPTDSALVTAVDQSSAAIRNILANPLPPPPPDVQFVQSQVSFTGPSHVNFSGKNGLKEVSGKRTGTESKSSAKMIIGNSFRCVFAAESMNYWILMTFALRILL
jgi:hypothetical protein